MPIYSYQCKSCGFAKDVLRKLSDPLLTDCPHCGVASFKKQLTSAGFHLKGSGWYATDFKGGAPAAAETGTASTTPDTAAPASTTETVAPKADVAPATAGCSAACSCH